VADLSDQPIKDHRGVMVGDRPDEASSDCVTLNFIDPCRLTGNPADLADKGLGVFHALTRTTDGQPSRHVRSTPLTDIERRYRRRCMPELSESIGDRRGSEHPVTTRQRCGPTSPPG
jgi:hypothetical protein